MSTPRRRCGPSIAALDAPDHAAYERLFPYYVEVCVVTQLRPRGAKPGGPGGHATMFIGGASLERGSAEPRLRLAEAEHAAGTGVGISVNRAFANANWIAVAGRDMFLSGGVRDDEPLDETRFDAAVRRAASAGWFDGIRLVPAIERQASRDVESVVRRSIGTDFALTFGRTVYAARLPIPRPALERVLDHLNELNELARLRGYVWNALTNNCSHVIHNALAAAGVWDAKAVRGGRPLDTLADVASLASAVVRRRMSDFSFPANNFVRLYEAANLRPIDDARSAFRDHDIRRTLRDDWLVTGPGGLVIRYPMHEPSRNDLFRTGRDPVLASVPLLWDKRRTFDRITRRPAPHETDLAANLGHFRDRFARAFAGRDRADRSDPRVVAFEERYHTALASELARIDAGSASVSNVAIAAQTPS